MLCWAFLYFLMSPLPLALLRITLTSNKQDVYAICLAIAKDHPNDVVYFARMYGISLPQLNPDPQTPPSPPTESTNEMTPPQQSPDMNDTKTTWNLDSKEEALAAGLEIYELSHPRGANYQKDDAIYNQYAMWRKEDNDRIMSPSNSKIVDKFRGLLLDWCNNFNEMVFYKGTYSGHAYSYVTASTEEFLGCFIRLIQAPDDLGITKADADIAYSKLRECLNRHRNPDTTNEANNPSLKDANTYYRNHFSELEKQTDNMLQLARSTNRNVCLYIVANRLVYWLDKTAKIDVSEDVDFCSMRTAFLLDLCKYNSTAQGDGQGSLKMASKQMRLPAQKHSPDGKMLFQVTSPNNKLDVSVIEITDSSKILYPDVNNEPQQKRDKGVVAVLRKGDSWIPLLMCDTLIPTGVIWDASSERLVLHAYYTLRAPCETPTLYFIEFDYDITDDQLKWRRVEVTEY